MKKNLEHLKSRVFSGIVLFIPVYIIFTFLQKLWLTLGGIGIYIAEALGIQHLLGNTTVTIATTLLLVLFFYILGWLVKLSFVKSFKVWIESGLLQYLPNYLTFKSKMKEKLLRKKDAWQPVMVEFGTYRRPGLLVETRADNAIVFFPNAPDSNNGQTHVVKIQQVEHLPTDTATLLKSLQTCGKNLPV